MSSCACCELCVGKRECMNGCCKYIYVCTYGWWRDGVDDALTISMPGYIQDPWACT